MVHYLQGDKGNAPFHDWQPSCEINTTRIYKKKPNNMLHLKEINICEFRIFI